MVKTIRPNNARESDKIIKYYEEQLKQLYKDMSNLADHIWRIQQLLILEEMKQQITTSTISPMKQQTLLNWIQFKEEGIS